MEALFVSTLVVALGEIGDKTQLLSLLLAARFQRPLPIIWGIFVATLANHFLAGLVGAWVHGAIGPDVLRIVMSMVEAATALAVPGNHDLKLVRKLRGRDVQITHGLAESLAQLQGELKCGTNCGSCVPELKKLIRGQLQAA